MPLKRPEFDTNSGQINVEGPKMKEIWELVDNAGKNIHIDRVGASTWKSFKSAGSV